MNDKGIRLVLIARIPATGIAAFQDYEYAVLPLLAAHGQLMAQAGAETELLRLADIG